MNRPTVVTLFGACNIALFAYGVLGLVSTRAILDLPGGEQAANPGYAPLLEYPALLIFLKTSIVAGAGLSVLQLASGLGLLRMKAWARRLAIQHAIVLASLCFVGRTLDVAVYLPALVRHADAVPEPTRTAMFVGGVVGLVVGLAAGFVYPLALIWFLTRKQVVAAFASPAEGDPPPLPASN